MRPIATDVWRGRSVDRVTDRYPAKTAGPIEMLFGVWGGVGPNNQGNGQFWGISSPIE